MSRDHYSTGPAKLVLDDTSEEIEIHSIEFDSGATFTYFISDAFEPIYDMIDHGLSETPLLLKDESFMSICWGVDTPFKIFDEVKMFFRDIKLNFGDGKLLALQPQDYIIISPSGNVCLGIIEDAEFTLIGDISMIDKLVVYDNENGLIGWIDNAKCSSSTGIDYQHNGILESVRANVSVSWSNI